MERIYIIEDDENIRNLLKIALEGFGYAAEGFETAEEGLARMREEKPDLVIFDWMLPGMDGTEAIKEVRNTEQLKYVPIMLLTAKSEVEDKIHGLDCGADDYLTKPFEFPELVARLRALGRRSQPARTPVLEAHGVRLDPFRREVYRDGHFIHLSPKEFAVLQVLMEAEGGVLSAETLLEKAWDANADPFTNSTRVTISHLRRKLGEPRVIQTVPGAGYRFSA